MVVHYVSELKSDYVQWKMMKVNDRESEEEREREREREREGRRRAFE